MVMPLHTDARQSGAPAEFDINPLYVRLAQEPVLKHALPRHPMLPDTAYQVVRDELILDGNARLNLATFVTTWMEPQARQLMTDCLEKNMIDKDEYPQTAELESRCVNILADLWHAPECMDATGCSTTGSSEACMLGGMALLWRWRERRRSVKAATDRPNLVMGTNVQVCWEKFCRYWQVEPRMVPMVPGRYPPDRPGGGGPVRREHYRRGGDPGLHHGRQLRAGERDQRRAGPAGRRRRPGRADPRGRRVRRVRRAVHPARPGLGLPGAPGGLDQHLGHKYGLVYPGVGWVVWREAAALPQDLVFNVNYLGGQMPTFALNFSRPGAQVAAQYYNFLRLGFPGYQRVHQACQDVAVHMSGQIAAMGPFELITEGRDLPVFAFKLADPAGDGYTVFDLTERLRTRGWLVPAYTFPEALTDTAVIRIVVRNGFGRDLADAFLSDLDHHWRALAAHPGSQVPLAPEGKRQSFAH